MGLHISTEKEKLDIEMVHKQVSSTDGLVFAYIMDVVVFDPHKGKGLGKKLVQHILDRSDVKKVNTVALKTMDAHSFYEALGFKNVGDSKMWMSIERVKYD